MCCSIDGFIGGVPTMDEKRPISVTIVRADLLRREAGFTAKDIKTVDDPDRGLWKDVRAPSEDMLMFGG